MASVTVNLTGYQRVNLGGGAALIRWLDDVVLGSTFSANGTSLTLDAAVFWYTGPLSGRVGVQLVSSNQDFTLAFETNGRIIFEASDGETLEVTIGNADMSEPYNWIPANSTEVIAFANHVIGLTDQNATLTLSDDSDAAPSFADDTGDAQSWTVGTTITPITVPEATGFPTPTYTTFGIPAGVSFNTATRVISGTPTGAGSGTLRVRATNSQGLADWTAPYTTAADTSPPVFTDSTGDAQAWTQNQQITPITVPEASGTPTPTYALVGSLPEGIAFNTVTRIISGTPSTVASGTIRIRASNSEGNADWTVAYATTAFVPSGSANYDAIAMMSGAYAIRFTASGNYADYFESSPSEGMLLNNIPAGMFTDSALYWIERVRGADGGNSLAADNGQFYTAARFEFHRGGSSQQQRDFLPGLPDAYSWIIINETTEEFLMWPANGQSAGAGSSGGSFGGGFCVYVVIPTHIADTGGLNENNVKAIAQQLAGTNPLNSAGQFNDNLLNSEVIVGLVPNATFRPTFGTSHAVDAGDASWTFAVAEPTVTHTVAPPPNQPPVVNIATSPMTVRGGQSVAIAASATDSDGAVVGYLWSGGGTFTPATSPGTIWTAPAGMAVNAVYSLVLTVTDDDGDTGQAIVAMTVRAAMAHEINAGDAAWTFSVSEPTVAHTRHHAVDAADASWTFAVPEPAVTHTLAPLEPGASQTIILQVGTGHGGERTLTGLLGDAQTLINPGYVDAGGTAYLRTLFISAYGVPCFLQLSGDLDSGTGQEVGPEFSTMFEQDGILEIVLDGHSLTLSGIADSTEPYSWTPENQSEIEAWLGAVAGTTATTATATLSFTEPTSHAVDAGDAAWTFVVSQPTITHQRNHVVDAGDVAWTFAVLQPTVIHGHDHVVNAGDVSWTFVVAEPTVTRASNHRVDASDVSWIFSVAQPTIAHTQAHAVDAGDVAWTFAISEPTVTHVRAVAEGPVTLVLGPPTQSSDAWVQWDNRNAPVGLGDISYFTGVDGETRYLVRLRIFRNGGVQVQTIDVPDGSSGFGSTEQLSDTWQAYASAVTVQVAGLMDLVLTGPTNSESSNTDPTEPYQWTNGNSAEQATWFDAYVAAGSPSATVRFADKDAAVDHTVNAGDAAWTFAVSQPTVRHTHNHVVDAGAVEWTFVVAEPTVTHQRNHRADAGDVSWTFAVSEPTVTHGHDHAVDAGDVAWTFDLPQPTVASARVHVVNASDVSWTFDVPQPDRTHTIAHRVDAGNVAWTFAVPQLTVSIQHEHTANAGDVSWVFDVPAILSGPDSTPSYILEVDWDNDGTFAHAESDVSNKLVNAPLIATRGRNFSGQVYGQVVAGSMRIRLWDNDRLYDRFNSGSALADLAVPKVGLRLRMSNVKPAVLVTTIWQGYVDTFRRHTDQRTNFEQAEMDCLGPMSLWGPVEIEVPLLADPTVAESLTELLELAGEPTRRIGTLNAQRRMTYWWASEGTRAIEAGRELEQTDGGILYETADGKTAFQGSSYRVNQRDPVATFEIGGTAGASVIPVTDASPEDPLTDIANIVRIPVRQYSVPTAIAVLWSLPVSVEIGPRDTFTVLATYPEGSETANARHLGVASWTTIPHPLRTGELSLPAVDLDLRANTDGTGADRASQFDVTVVPTLNNLEITLQNTHASNTSYLTRLQPRGQPLVLEAPLVVTRRDQDSVDDYGPRPYRLPAQFINSVLDAEDYARLILGERAIPSRRQTLDWYVGHDPLLASTLDISDRVTVQQQGNATDMFVESVQHRLAPNGDHIIRMIVTPVSAGAASIIVLDVGPGIGPAGIGILGR